VEAVHSYNALLSQSSIYDLTCGLLCTRTPIQRSKTEVSVLTLRSFVIKETQVTVLIFMYYFVARFSKTLLFKYYFRFSRILDGQLSSLYCNFVLHSGDKTRAYICHNSHRTLILRLDH
jgi:hypothetical protein